MKPIAMHWQTAGSIHHSLVSNSPHIQNTILFLLNIDALTSTKKPKHKSNELEKVYNFSFPDNFSDTKQQWKSFHNFF